jgi:DNA polymerase III subunit delta'
MFDYVLSDKASPDWLLRQLSTQFLPITATQNVLSNFSPTTAVHDPHATGGAQYAVLMAHALLCAVPFNELIRSSRGGLACGQCAQCLLLKVGNHPDLMTLVPENIDAQFLSQLKSAGKADKDKKPSKTIKIKQLRALEHTFTLSSQRGGRKVVIIYPAELLGSVTANALLKTLEEPMPNTFFIVVSQNWGQVLPTLRSRCVCHTLIDPDLKAKTAWLESQKITHSKRWLELSAGKIEIAMNMAQDPLWMPLLKLMPYLLEGARIDAIGLAQEMAKADLSRVTQALTLWLHDILAVSQGVPARFFASHTETMQRSVQTLNPESAAHYAIRLNEMAAISEHPLNARVQCEFLLLEYKKMFS